MKVQTCALSLSALLILRRPLYSNFHGTRQFSFASSVIPKHQPALAVVVWLHLVLCRGEARRELLQPLFTLSVLFPPQT